MTHRFGSGFVLRCALAVVMALGIAACFPGGGTEDTNDLQVSGRLMDVEGNRAPHAMVFHSSEVPSTKERSRSAPGAPLG